MKKNHPKHSTTEAALHHYQRYMELQTNGEKPGIILRMAEQIDLSPSLLARIILERFIAEHPEEGQIATRQYLSQLMRDTTRIKDKHLALEIFMCNVEDDDYSPITEVIKYNIGEEYEIFLKKKVKAIGIPFLDENQLQQKGYDKTPDVKLEIPIAVGGKVVNWIESKALFGDPSCHDGYLRDQYWSYWNRFGPGMVIYWFGYVDELDVHRDKGIILKDHFPEEIVFMDPLSL